MVLRIKGYFNKPNNTFYARCHLLFISIKFVFFHEILMGLCALPIVEVFQHDSFLIYFAWDGPTMHFRRHYHEIAWLQKVSPSVQY